MIAYSIMGWLHIFQNHQQHQYFPNVSKVALVIWGRIREGKMYTTLSVINMIIDCFRKTLDLNDDNRVVIFILVHISKGKLELNNPNY